jgi:hypothetical protein
MSVAGRSQGPQGASARDSLEADDSMLTPRGGRPEAER